MKNKQLFELSDVLSSIKELKGVTFNYAVARNLGKLKTEIDIIKQAGMPKDNFSAYDAARIELCKTMSKKDDKGEPVVEKGQFILEDQSAFETAFTALKVEHKDAITTREEQIKDFNTLLEKESDIELFKIDLKLVPEDITTDQMKGILPMIKE